MEIEFFTFLINGLAALIAGFSMGLERQMKGKHAGLKTNMLVALGASVYIMLSLLFKGDNNTDMTRIIGQIVVGVGFLGAGVILHNNSKNRIEGLATAATIWCSAASGCLAGLGEFYALGGFTLMVIMVNIVFGFLNRKISQ